MENYTGNSLRSRRDEVVEQDREHKVKQVVDSGASVKKKTGFGKFFADLVSGDMHSVKEYLVEEVFLPSLKSTVSDAISNGVDMLLYGESRSKRYSNSSGPKVSYNSMYSKDYMNKSYIKPERASSISDFDGVLVDTRAKANDILAEMYDVLDEYKVISIADLYMMAKIPTKSIDYDWGWYEIHDVAIVRWHGQYLIKMPKPVSIK